jgi:ABC-type uncharacterized transport system substrate-binding protein
MTRVFRFVRAFAFAALALPLTGGIAAAHPHVFVDAKAELVFNPQGEITAVRHIWQFDPEFTAMATLNLDANNDGKLDEKELEPLAKTNMDSLKEYDFFTYLLVGRKKEAFAAPTEYWLDFHNQQLTLFYTLPLKTPLALKGEATLEVYDPEYFVAFTFIKDNPVTLDGAPPTCSAVYHPPHELDAQTMTVLSAIPYEQHDLPPDLLEAARSLANVIELKCAS